MSSPPRQLALDLPHPPSYAREDFLVARENAEALSRIEAWPNWPNPALLLIGPRGSGKTHLGSIWAERAGALTLSGRDLERASVPDIAGAPLFLDDADEAAGAGEAALFHLINLSHEQGTSLLYAAPSLPDLWGLATPDLVSRLRLAPVVRLGEPDLELMRAVLTKLFSDRQVAVDPAVIAYVALRIERSLEAAANVVAALDREALARGKGVTRALAAEILRCGDGT